MKVSHQWLQAYFKDTLPSAEVLADLFTFHSFEIDGIEEVGNDKVIDAKILPDRAHFCLSHKGIAEEVKVLTGLPYANALELFSGEDSSEVIKVTIQDENFCRRYISRKITGLSIQDSSEDIQKLLSAVGGRAINSVVDATNFVMFDIGQPLHAFDADKVVGDLVVRPATEGETIVLLDGREVALTVDDSVIADDNGPLAIAGVKGGKRAEVNKETKNIILEAANFHPTKVRKTATKYNLRNESSKRFENEITAELALEGMKKVTGLIKKLHPDALVGPIVDLYPHPEKERSISIAPEFIDTKLGVEISEATIITILESLGINVERKGSELELTIPHHRLDLLIKEDIVEEVGRIYGYDKIIGTKQIPVSAEVSAHPAFYSIEKIKDILVAAGFSETYLYTFVNKGDVEVSYPLASDKKALRTNLSEGVTKALEMNARNADLLFLDSIKIFEIGKVFTQKKGEEIQEHTSLCIGIKRIKKVKGQSANEDIRQTREQLLAALGANVQTVCTIDDTGGLLMLEGKEIGVINNIEGIMEVNLDVLIPHIETPAHESIGFVPTDKISYKPFSTYPFIVRDIAVFVPDSVKPEDIEQIIREEGTELLLKYQLFDTFQKDGKTSYAFRMIFQSYERTLTDDETNKIMETISKKMKEKGWEVR